MFLEGPLSDFERNLVRKNFALDATGYHGRGGPLPGSSYRCRSCGHWWGEDTMSYRGIVVP